MAQKFYSYCNWDHSMKYILNAEKFPIHRLNINVQIILFKTIYLIFNHS